MVQERVAVSWFPAAMRVRTADAAPPLPVIVSVLEKGKIVPLADSCTTLPSWTVMWEMDAVPVPSTEYTTVEPLGGGLGAGTWGAGDVGVGVAGAGVVASGGGAGVDDGGVGDSGPADSGAGPVATGGTGASSVHTHPVSTSMTSRLINIAGLAAAVRLDADMSIVQSSYGVRRRLSSSISSCPPSPRGTTVPSFQFSNQGGSTPFAR
jgi:hypothetical protein